MNSQTTELQKLLTDAAEWVDSVHDGEWPYHPFTRDDLVSRLRATALEHAQRVAQPASSDLVQRCQEILNWQKTGLLQGEAVRALASSSPLREEHQQLMWAEKETAAEAMKFVIAAAPSAGEAEARDAARPPGFVKPDNDKQVFFYEQDFYVLSNFSAFTLKWHGFRFDTSEAAYHFAKFDHEDNPHAYPIAREIRSAPSAHEAFKIAERNKAYRRTDWDTVKVDIMRDILRAKALQHEYVRRKLLATGDRELIEDSWRDDFWGWGPNRDGKNMLGKLWMEVRAELRAAMASGSAG